MVGGLVFDDDALLCGGEELPVEMGYGELLFDRGGVESLCRHRASLFEFRVVVVTFEWFAAEFEPVVFERLLELSN